MKNANTEKGKNAKVRSRYGVARGLLIFWTLFVGVGAVAGAAAMLIDPSGKVMGMDAMLPYFVVLPFADVLFTNFTFSGISLLIVNGLTNLTAAVLLIMNKKAGSVLGGIFGVTLMLWICIQFYMFPANFMSTAFFIIGFCQAVTGYAACVFYKQEHFTVDESSYPNIGTSPDRLVVYFSRMGYAKKLAFEEANRTGAAVYEVKPTEKTDGTLGFWWCGRFGMHRWDMPVEDIGIDFSKAEHVVIVSPIWVFSLASPMRAFCRAVKDKVKNFDIILVHHTNGRYDNAAEEIDGLIGAKHAEFRSVRCRKGDYKEISGGRK